MIPQVFAPMHAAVVGLGFHPVLNFDGDERRSGDDRRSDTDRRGGENR